MNNVLDIQKLLNSDEFKQFFNSFTLPTTSTNSKFNCSECKSNDLITDTKNGIIVCKNCGQENGSIIDTAQEWKSYDYNNNNARSNILTYSTNKLQYYNNFSYKNISFIKECKNITHICEKFKIPKNIDHDAKIIRKIISEYKHKSGKNIGKFKIIRGNNRISINANCIYLASIKNDYAISIPKLATMFNITEKDINKGYKTCKLILNDNKLTLTYMTPSFFIKNYCIELKIIDSDIIIAQNIALNINKLKLAMNFTTISLTAASILLLCHIQNLNITKLQIASLFNISIATILKAFNIILPYKNILMDNIYIDAILDNINVEINKLIIPPFIQQKMLFYNLS